MAQWRLKGKQTSQENTFDDVIKKDIVMQSEIMKQNITEPDLT